MEQNKKEETIQKIASLAANRYVSTLNTKLAKIDRDMNKAAYAIEILGLLKVAAQLIDSHADEIKTEQTARLNGLFDYISTNENIKKFKISKNNSIMKIRLNLNKLVINDPNTIRDLCEAYPNDLPRSCDFRYVYEQNPDDAINNYELYYENGYFEVDLQINPFNTLYVDFSNSLENGFDENNFTEIYDKIDRLTKIYNNASEGDVIQDFINLSISSFITGDTQFMFELDGYEIGPFMFKNFEKYQELAEAPLSVIIDNICNLNNINLITKDFFRSAFRRISARKKGVTENANN